MLSRQLTLCFLKYSCTFSATVVTLDYRNRPFKDFRDFQWKHGGTSWICLICHEKTVKMEGSCAKMKDSQSATGGHLASFTAYMTPSQKQEISTTQQEEQIFVSSGHFTSCLPDYNRARVLPSGRQCVILHLNDSVDQRCDRTPPPPPSFAQMGAEFSGGGG